jgi:hypothetical protein
MKAIINADAKVLIPNKEHKNFTETDEVIEEGTEVEGAFKNITGLRRGKPFTYKLFITDKEKILYQKFLTPMETTEVTLGADAQVSPTQVNMKPAEAFSKVKLGGVVLGGAAAYFYAKRKKMSTRKTAMWIGLGALIGYGAGYVIDKNRDITIKPSK